MKYISLFFSCVFIYDLYVFYSNFNWNGHLVSGAILGGLAIYGFISLFLPKKEKIIHYKTPTKIGQEQLN